MEVPCSVSELAAGHQLELTRFAYLLTADRQRAEDLVQDVLTSVWRRFGDDLPMANPLAYVRKSIVNANVSRVRRRSSTERTFGLVPGEPHRRQPDSPAHDALWTAMQALPVRQRAVLALRFFADLSDADIAATLGCRTGTVSSAAARALATLRTQLTIPEELS